MSNEYLGHALDSVTFWLPVKPRPKPYDSANRLAKSHRARVIAEYHRRFAEEVTELSNCIINRDGRHKEWRLDLYYSVSVKYYLPVHKTGKLEGQVCRADLDNLTKSLLDCLNGVAWDDDGQVFELSRVSRSSEVYSPSGRPGIFISITAYEWQDWM